MTVDKRADPPAPGPLPMRIPDTLQKFGYFHDWYLDEISTGRENGASTPNALELGLYDQNRRATITFKGVTRASITDGGLLNIVNSIEVLKPGDDAYCAALEMLKKSAHFGGRYANHIAYVFSTVGIEIAVEFDSITVEAI
ncbi:hypothetical protein LJ656_21380 [Paraburkholderia sp. MMS20-SJTR3]|uniref:Uncharacterized protein n=1 Tax=Paraburkholderia sejongensis TaxID=2886946 RepID=A0ABS8JZ26_9BURK|nr:hypothetical protein [Paraburkholderia sp. MMS20-SJTR3]MCC8395144.1 hypothetical protein [Paraburkholderia sp. MMS20-SJTR3]